MHHRASGADERITLLNAIYMLLINIIVHMMCRQTLENRKGANMNIGKSLKIALLKNDMEQSDAAEKMGIHQSHVSKISCGKAITTETLARLAKTFDMKVSEFIALGED